MEQETVTKLLVIQTAVDNMERSLHEMLGQCLRIKEHLTQILLARSK